MHTVVPLKSVNQAKQYPPLYLHLTEEHQLPLVLGTGRNAVVVIATTTDDPTNPATSYRAIKFLRSDADEQYAIAAADRFFQEAGQAQKFPQHTAAFVLYHGWGSIDHPDDGKYWWKVQFRDHVPAIVNADDALTRLRRHFNLQGPFYVLDLCQGTLHDMLDKAIAWHELPPYSVSVFRNSITGERRRAAADIADVTRRFFHGSVSGLSGYEILNAFRSDDTDEGRTANRIRNFAVLEMFAEIADTVAKLHSRKDNQEPLAHRDLKPGNIFFQHSAFDQSLEQIKIKLSDLGYVTTPAGIAGGDKTLVAGKKGAEYLAPGSQFFRAPEQAELPIEVRVDLDSSNSKIVRIKGSKISDIQIHDWLSLSDLFADRAGAPDAQQGLFKIMRVEYSAAENIYQLELDQPVRTSRTGDMQGQVTRATGFHTDGFSLGAILYDLISGGRDPELFYTYCLASYINRFSQESLYSVDDIVEILSPLPTRGNGERYESDKLSLSEKTRATQQVWAAHDLDGMLSAIQDAVILQRNRGETAGDDRLREKLKNFRFRNFHLVRELLTDRRGVPIPRDILDVIVRCMVRDVDGAYYRRDAEHAFLSDANYAAASAVYGRIQELLAKEENQLPREGFPRSLQTNLLFKLRSLAQRADDGE